MPLMPMLLRRLLTKEKIANFNEFCLFVVIVFVRLSLKKGFLYIN